ncbi:MAG: hypothetical protein HYY24_11100 [Verrucomicrobia bacterium]|nr:hypothetical protein [Verrucomicrobiota bacterium]
MTAAILQGAPATTLDVDVWIDLRPRQYIRILNLCRRLGAEIVANTVVCFDGSLTLNFLYEVTGLDSFDDEYRRAEQMNWFGETVAVLPLARILASKEVIQRPKDIAHIPLLRQTIELRERLRGAKGS